MIELPRSFREWSVSSPSPAMKHGYVLKTACDADGKCNIFLHTPSVQVGLVSYSTGAAIEFDLNEFQNVEDVMEAIGDVVYTRGWTATALALALTRFMLDPELAYGARPFSNGIPKVAVLITDGRSNQLPITERADALRNFGVQVCYRKLVL